MSSTEVLGYNTLIDVVNQYTSLDGSAQFLWAAKVLHRKCPLVRMLPMLPSNQIMSNIGLRESTLPTVGTRRFNYGVLPTASHASPYTEPIAMFEDYSEVDKALWKLQNDPNAWRQEKDEKKVEALTQKLENEFFYGSIATDPASFNGLATRFNSTTAYPNGDSTWFYNVLDGGGASGNSGAFTSAWVIEFGKGKVFGIYPKNLPGGLEIEDLGEDTKDAGSGYLFQVLRTHLTWFAGLVVEDERCVQRICNIDTTANVSTGIFDEELFITAKNRLPGSGEDSGTAILVNRTLKTQMDKRAVSQKINTYFTQEKTGDVWGRPVTRFQGIPVIVAEKIVSTETTVS